MTYHADFFLHSDYWYRRWFCSWPAPESRREKTVSARLCFPFNILTLLSSAAVKPMPKRLIYSSTITPPSLACVTHYTQSSCPYVDTHCHYIVQCRRGSFSAHHQQKKVARVNWQALLLIFSKFSSHCRTYPFSHFEGLTALSPMLTTVAF